MPEIAGSNLGDISEVTLEDLAAVKQNLMAAISDQMNTCKLSLSDDFTKNDDFELLFTKEAEVSDLFTQFFTLFEEPVNGDLISDLQLAQMETLKSQVHQLMRIRNRFIARIDSMAQISEDNVSDIMSHVDLLMKCRETVRDANCMDELEQVQIPVLNGVGEDTDSEIEDLAEEWDGMELKEKIQHCILELMEIRT